MAMAPSLESQTYAPAARLRLLIVDEQPLLREGLRASLASESSIDVVAAAGSMNEAIALAAQHAPGVVLTELRAGSGGLGELMAGLERARQQPHVVVLTRQAGEQQVRQAIAAGVRAYVSKDDGYSELLEALRVVAVGRRFFSDTVESQILAQYAERVLARHSTSGASITPREREVLARIGQGQTNKDIARALHLSVKTVEKHRSNVMRKLNLHNTAALTVYAIRQGLISPDESRGDG
jgi:DNA-binding NarL/FixJ family response regulator